MSDTMTTAFETARACGAEIAGRLGREAASTHVHERNQSVRVVCTDGAEVYVAPDGCHLKRPGSPTIKSLTLDGLAEAAT